MVIQYEAYCVKGFSCTVYNPVPMTQQLAIQGTTTFTAFNNTIYSLGTKDDLYETAWYDWNDPTGTAGFNNFNLAYKEGYYLDQPKSTTQKRTVLPVYYWTAPNTHVADVNTWMWNDNVTGYSSYPSGNAADRPYIPDGVFWDPLTSASDIMELRPGKNSMTWSWNPHPCDENTWFNFDQLARWVPYVRDMPWPGQADRIGQAGSNQPDPGYEDPYMLATESTWRTTTGANKFNTDPTIANLANVPIVPAAWWWQELNKSIINNDDRRLMPALNFPGTEYEQYKYPPTQCFIKGLPLFDDDGNHIVTTTQGCFQVSLTVACKPRRSKIFAPTWGPLPWSQTHAIDAPRVGSYVRYRTGGARRTWGNLKHAYGVSVDTADNQGNYSARYAPYNTSTYSTTGTAASHTTTYTYTTAK